MIGSLQSNNNQQPPDNNGTPRLCVRRLSTCLKVSAHLCDLPNSTELSHYSFEFTQTHTIQRSHPPLNRLNQIAGYGSLCKCYQQYHHLFFLILLPGSTLSEPLNLAYRSSHLRLCEVQSTLQGHYSFRQHSAAQTQVSSVQRCLFHGPYRSYRIAVVSVIALSLLCRSLPLSHPGNSSDMSEELSNANNKSACGYFNRFLWFLGCRRSAICLRDLLPPLPSFLDSCPLLLLP